MHAPAEQDSYLLLTEAFVAVLEIGRLGHIRLMTGSTEAADPKRAGAAECIAIPKAAPKEGILGLILSIISR